MCQDCVENMANAISFKDKCLRSDIILRRNRETTSAKIQGIVEEPNVMNNQGGKKSRRKSTRNPKNIKTAMMEDTFKVNTDHTREAKKIKLNDSTELPSNNKITEEKVQNEKNLENRDDHKNEEKPRKNARKKKKQLKPPLPPGPPYNCGICSKALKTYTGYYTHLTLHSDKMPYLCNICGERFKTKCSYNGHSMTHRTDNPNSCNDCGKSYRNSGSLKIHKLSHSEEKPFLCPICGKGTTQMSSLKVHIMSHSQTERSCKCEICGKLFFSIRHRNNHIRKTHNKTKSFICNV